MPSSSLELLPSSSLELATTIIVTGATNPLSPRPPPLSYRQNSWENLGDTDNHMNVLRADACGAAVNGKVGVCVGFVWGGCK